MVTERYRNKVHGFEVTATLTQFGGGAVFEVWSDGLPKMYITPLKFFNFFEPLPKVVKHRYICKNALGDYVFSRPMTDEEANTLACPHEKIEMTKEEYYV